MFYWHLSLTFCWEVQPDSFCKILVRQAHNIQNCDEAKQYSIQFCNQDDISNFFRFSMIYSIPFKTEGKEDEEGPTDPTKPPVEVSMTIAANDENGELYNCKLTD